MGKTKNYNVKFNVFTLSTIKKNNPIISLSTLMSKIISKLNFHVEIMEKFSFEIDVKLVTQK